MHFMLQVASSSSSTTPQSLPIAHWYTVVPSPLFNIVTQNLQTLVLKRLTLHKYSHVDCHIKAIHSEPNTPFTATLTGENTLMSSVVGTTAQICAQRLAVLSITAFVFPLLKRKRLWVLLQR